MHQYVIDGEVLDSLDLKVLLVAEGMHVGDEVCEAFASTTAFPRRCGIAGGGAQAFCRTGLS